MEFKILERDNDYKKLLEFVIGILFFFIIVCRFGIERFRDNLFFGYVE